jgi:dTDP-4-dehydrorhamnose reductase
VKYLVLGAFGQLGRAICPRLEGEVIELRRVQADLARPETVVRSLLAARPEVVINCAAYNLVDKAESDPEEAFAVNTWGVRHLARLCGESDCTLVHFSSDYVFGQDESRQTPYHEADAPGPVNVYGLSKLTGEFWVRSLAPRHFVIRTCGLYGVHGIGGKGRNFVEIMLRLAGEGKPIRVVNDQTCTPTYAADLAEVTIRLMQSERHGLYHVTNAGSCTWFELARRIFELEGIKADLKAITSQEYGAAARRPRYSVLEAKGCRSLDLPPLRTWEEALQAYLEERRHRHEAVDSAPS